MSQEQFLVLMQSFAASILLIGPLLILSRAVYRYFITEDSILRMQNWNDTIIRPVALVLFLAMVFAGLYLFFAQPNYYALLGPIEVILGFFFFPLYKRMD